MDVVPNFVSAAEDAELLKTLRAEVYKHQGNTVHVSVVSAKGKKKRLSRRDDWNLQDNSFETNASLVLMVSRWSSSPLSTGMRFLKDLDLASAARLDYADVWAVVEGSLVSLASGKYNCGTCFDTRLVLSLGDGCCGKEYCTDVCNAARRECPAYHPSPEGGL